jgi:predicted amidohydrolase YtcJ
MNTNSGTRVSRRDVLRMGGLVLATGGLEGLTGRPLQYPISSLLESTCSTPTGRPLSGPPDLILKNGDIHTVDAAQSTAQAIAIQGGLIQAVGSDAAIASLAAPTTQMIDVGGRVVTPGLIDPHVHFRLIGLQNRYYTTFLPPDVRDISSLQAALADAVGALEDGEWVVGFYLVLSDRPIPTKDDLDPVSPHNPVFLMHIGGHWATANSAALAIAGVTSATASPEGGIIEMGGDGEPTGVLYNHRAMDRVRAFAPAITHETVRSAILSTQTLMAACGVTSFQDNNIRELEHIRAYQDLTREGSLFLRNTLYLTLEWPADMAKVSQVDPVSNDVTRFAGYKLLIDGQAPTAYCHEAHSGAEWRMPTWDPDIFKQAITTLHNTGLQICVHCIGDAAADLILDAYEEAMDATPRSDPRHRLEHAVLTTPQATQRIKDLSVVVSTNPAFIYITGDGYKKYFGDERLNRIMVTREWLDAGIHMTIGSDAPSTPYYNPQFTLAGAMSRRTYSQWVLGASQALTWPEALRAHTIEAAYAAHEEGVKGSLEPNKFADIVVWEEDPATMTIADLAMTTTVYMTLVGGRVVYPQSHAFLPFVQR